MPPAVAPGRELRLAAARVVVDRELADVQLLLGRPHHHLRRELHAGGVQVELRQHGAAHGAHAAMGVAHAGPEEEVERAAQDRVADVAVQPRHRAGLDAIHAVAHHEIGAGIEVLDEVRDLGEVVRQVGVGHHDVAPARRGEARQVGAAVAAPRLVDRRARRRPRRARRCRPRRRCRRRRPLRPARARRSPRARCDAGLDVLGLVEAGDHDRDEDLVLASSESAAQRRGCARWCSYTTGNRWSERKLLRDGPPW